MLFGNGSMRQRKRSGMKNERELTDSPIVANCRMNRERELAGRNSYTCDLGFNPAEFLTDRCRDDHSVRFGTRINWTAPLLAFEA